MAALTLKTLAFLFLVSVCTQGALAKTKKKLEAVEDMRYGVALYHYYQGDYMAALTELLIAKERGGIKGHGDNPEIMEGGFSLGFGLERHASEIFERLLQENRSERSRDAAWFFLSKLRYLRQDWQGAEAALEKVRSKPAQDIRSEVYAHRINLAIRQNQLDLAERLLKKQPPADDWMPYVNYNFGSAYARLGDYNKAIEYFEKLAIEPYPTDELRALYDKAMTASGYAYLITEQHELAIQQFTRVRLTSGLSNRALLGYGWAAARLGRFEEALKPWDYLAKSSLVDESSQEGLIAVPYAYEMLGSQGLALEHFMLAEQIFLEERARLQTVIENMQGNHLLDALKIERSSGMDWLKHVRENQVTPQLGYLAELFSREDFQGIVQELRDLVGIREDLLEWQEKIAFYTDLIDQQKLGRAEKAEALAAREFSATIQQMKEKRAELARQVEYLAVNQDYFLLATSDEKALIDRVLRSQKHVASLRATDPYIDESAEAVRRYYGILYWDASENYSDRFWRVVKTLNLLDKTLATVSKNHDKVNYLINNPDDLEPIRARLQLADTNLRAVLQQTDSAIALTQDSLRKQTATVLDAQAVRLNHYIAQSRLSIARLYDKSLQAEIKAKQPPEQPEVDAAKPAAPAQEEETAKEAQPISLEEALEEQRRAFEEAQKQRQGGQTDTAEASPGAEVETDGAEGGAPAAEESVVEESLVEESVVEESVVEESVVEESAVEESGAEEPATENPTTPAESDVEADSLPADTSDSSNNANGGEQTP